MRESLPAHPSLTLVLVVTPGTPDLEALVAEVLPSCREYGVELLVAGGVPGQRLTWDGEVIRCLPGGPGETELELRSRAMAEARGNIVLFLAGEAVPSMDVAALLGHRTGILSGDFPDAGEASAPAGRSLG